MPEGLIAMVISVLFVAIHMGPYLSLKPMETFLTGHRCRFLLEGAAANRRTEEALRFDQLGSIVSQYGNLEAYLKAERITVIFRSSSEHISEANIEDMLTTAANNVGVPVFVIEDFPGNFYLKSGQKVDGLFVEDSTVADLHVLRGLNPQAIWDFGNPRYCSYQSVDRDSLRAQMRELLEVGNGPVWTWAGQSDGKNSFDTLKRLIARFDQPGITLLFRAHPRDEFYAINVYRELFENINMSVIDVSNFNNATAIYCASDVVVTQFSSAGVEASYMGIPAVFTLFEDLGKEYLRVHKGYDMVPWSSGTCSFLIEDDSEVKYVMERAIFDCTARRLVMKNFELKFNNKDLNVLSRIWGKVLPKIT